MKLPKGAISSYHDWYKRTNGLRANNPITIYIVGVYTTGGPIIWKSVNAIWEAVAPTDISNRGGYVQKDSFMFNNYWFALAFYQKLLNEKEKEA